MALVLLDSLEFDTLQGGTPTAVHISGNVYAIVYRGVDGDGFVSTVTIDSAGSIGDAVINTFEFETDNCTRPHIYHISGNIYAITYGGPDSGGWVVTIEISTAGVITDPIVDSHEFDTSQGTLTSMVHISGTTYAIAYTGPGDDGWLKTLTIGNDGSISADPELDDLEFDTALCYYPYIMHISGDIYAILYMGRQGTTTYDWRIVTVDINSAGAIEDPVVDSLTIDTPGTPNASLTYVGRLYNVAGDIYAFGAQGEDAGGVEAVFVYTVEISSAGAIAAAATDSSKIALSANHSIDFFKTSGDVYVLAYTGVGDPGRLKTLDIADNGTIGSVVASLIFDSTRARTPFLFDITTTVMAVAYTGYESDGWLKTYGEAEASTVTTQATTDIASVTATGNGNVTGIGVPAAFQHGHCWSTAPNPTIVDDKTELGAVAATGPYTSPITALVPGTLYYTRAYVTNVLGTVYGAEVTFSTTSGVSGGNPGVVELLT